MGELYKVKVAPTDYNTNLAKVGLVASLRFSKWQKTGSYEYYLWLNIFKFRESILKNYHNTKYNKETYGILIYMGYHNSQLSIVYLYVYKDWGCIEQ